MGKYNYSASMEVTATLGSLISLPLHLTTPTPRLCLTAASHGELPQKLRVKNAWVNLSRKVGSLSNPDLKCVCPTGTLIYLRLISRPRVVLIGLTFAGVLTLQPGLTFDHRHLPQKRSQQSRIF